MTEWQEAERFTLDKLGYKNYIYRCADCGKEITGYAVKKVRGCARCPQCKEKFIKKSRNTKKKEGAIIAVERFYKLLKEKSIDEAYKQMREALTNE